MKPSVRKSILRFLGKVPIAARHRWPTHQQFAVVRDLAFDIWQRRTYCAQPQSLMSVDGNDRRSLRQSVTLKDADTHINEPLRGIQSERCATGDAAFHAAAKPRTDLAKHERIRQLPT